MPRPVTCAPPAAELSDSIGALGDVSISAVVSGGASTVTDAIDAVREDLGTVRSAAGTELRSQVQNVEDAISELETAVGAIGNGGSVRDAVTALGNVVSTAGTLLQELGTGCPTATSAPASTPTTEG